MLYFGRVNVEFVFKIETLYTAFSRTFDTKFTTEIEYHNFWEIMIVVDGEIKIDNGNEIRVLKKNQGILLKPMEYHRTFSENSSSTRIIVFSFGAKELSKNETFIFDVEDMSVPERILGDIYNTFSFNDINIVGITKREVDCAYVVKELEMFIASVLVRKSDDFVIAMTKSAKNYARAVNILENNIDKMLSVTEIARMCNMSESNLKKIFSHFAGMGVSAYFNRLKIQAAISLLESGESVTDIANILGFSSQSYFSTVFKKNTGVSPTTYVRNIFNAKSDI